MACDRRTGPEEAKSVVMTTDSLRLSSVQPLQARNVLEAKRPKIDVLAKSHNPTICRIEFSIRGTQSTSARLSKIVLPEAIFVSERVLLSWTTGALFDWRRL